MTSFYDAWLKEQKTFAKRGYVQKDEVVCYHCRIIIKKSASKRWKMLRGLQKPVYVRMCKDCFERGKKANEKWDRSMASLGYHDG